MNSISTNFISVEGDSQINLLESESKVKKGLFSSKSTYKNRTLSQGQSKSSPRRKSLPTTKQKDTEHRTLSPLQMKLQDPNAKWHDILTSECNKSIADEPSFHTKYGIDKNKSYPFKIKEYKAKVPTTTAARKPKCKSAIKTDAVGDGSANSIGKSSKFIATNKESSLEKGDSKKAHNSSTTEEFEVKDETQNHNSRPKTSSRDPITPLPHRSPQNKFSISKKKKDGESPDTLSNVSGILSNIETETSKTIPKSISEISSLFKTGKIFLFEINL